MAKSVSYVSDVPGDEGENVETLSFRIPGVDGNTYQITLDASEDIAAKIKDGMSTAHVAYVKALHKELSWLTKLGADENSAVKVTQVKPSEPKQDGTYNGDRGVNKAIREWAKDSAKGNMADKLPASGRGRIDEEVKAAFWSAVERGEVSDPRQGAQNDQEESGE